jgi:hypothetical protein
MAQHKDHSHTSKIVYFIFLFFFFYFFAFSFGTHDDPLSFSLANAWNVSLQDISFASLNCWVNRLPHHTLQYSLYRKEQEDPKPVAS